MTHPRVVTAPVQHVVTELQNAPPAAQLLKVVVIAATIVIVLVTIVSLVTVAWTVYLGQYVPEGEL